MSQLEKVGLLVYTAIKSGMLSPGKEYDFDFTMSSWNQKLGRQSLPTKALWDTDLGVQSWQIPKLEQKRYQESRIVFYLHSYKTYCLRILGELRCCSLKMHSFCMLEFAVSIIVSQNCINSKKRQNMAQKLVASFGTFSERKCTMALVLRILRRCQRRRCQSF